MKFITEYKEFKEDYVIDTDIIKDVLIDFVDEYDAELDIDPVHFWRPGRLLDIYCSTGHIGYDLSDINCYRITLTIKNPPLGIAKQVFQKLKLIREYYYNNTGEKIYFIIYKYTNDESIHGILMDPSELNDTRKGIYGRFTFYITTNNEKFKLGEKELIKNKFSII